MFTGKDARTRTKAVPREKGGGPRRGGERGPRARSGPGGGGRLRPYIKAYSRRAPESTTGRPQCSFQPKKLKHIRSAREQCYPKIVTHWYDLPPAETRYVDGL